MIKKFIANKYGATSIEYALIAVFIFLVIVVTLPLIGPRLSNAFTSVSNQLPTRVVAAPTPR